MNDSGSQSDDDNDKPYEASERKLTEARKRGQVAYSADLVTAASYAGLVAYLSLAGASVFLSAGSILQTQMEQALRGGTSVEEAFSLLRQGLFDLTLPVAGWFVAPAALALLAIVAQGGQVFAVTRITPSVSKVSPLSNLQQKLGTAGLVEFAKGLLKSTLFGVVLTVYLADRWSDITASLALDARQVVVTLFDISLDVLFLVTAVALVIGFLDLIWQRLHHLTRHRMTRREVEDEYKESEGDPMLKAQRRQAAISIAMNQAAQSVPKADVVIVNPTHYAVALTWNRTSGRAPTCCAKGMDEVALHIRRLAIEAGVPIRSDPPTARALHATVEVGQDIPRSHFKAVAAAIRFADKVRERARRK